LLQYGVGELTHTMLKYSLVDEFHILVYPFTFGEGPRIFEHMGATTLKLIDTKTFSSDVVALQYQPLENNKKKITKATSLSGNVRGLRPEWVAR
jgi:dihydrofolate reductase